MINWHLQSIPLKQLRGHPKNPRQISKEQYQHLTDLIAKFGFIDKPIINCDKTIICGHQRIRVLRKQKVKEVECWIPDRPLTDEEVEELMVRHNLNQGSFDYDILANVFEPLDLLTWGFSEEQLLGKFQDEDEESKEEKKDSSKAKCCPSCGCPL